MDGYLEEQERLLEWWKKTISDALGRGMESREVAGYVAEIIAEKAGVGVDELPKPVQVDIKVSVSGMIRYLQR